MIFVRRIEMCHDRELGEGVPEQLLTKGGLHLDAPLLEDLANGAQVGNLSISIKSEVDRMYVCIYVVTYNETKLHKHLYSSLYRSVPLQWNALEGGREDDGRHAQSAAESPHLVGRPLPVPVGHLAAGQDHLTGVHAAHEDGTAPEGAHRESVANAQVGHATVHVQGQGHRLQDATQNRQTHAAFHRHPGQEEFSRVRRRE